MKLIKPIGSRPESINSTRTKRWGLFECPVCSNQVEKPLSHGRRNKSCGAKDCKKAVLVSNPNPKPQNKKYKKTDMMYYDTFKSAHTRLCRVFNMSIELASLSKFTSLYYNMYAEARNSNPTVSFRFICTDGSDVLSVDTCKLVGSQQDYIPASRYVNGAEYSIRKLMEDTDSTYTVVNNAIRKFEVDCTEELIYTAGRHPLKNKVMSEMDYNNLKQIILDSKVRYPKRTSNKIYLLKSLHLYKIGIAHDVEKRVLSLACGNPFGIDIVAVADVGEEFAEKVETYLHTLHKDARTDGEWFELGTIVAEELKQVLSDPDKLIQEYTDYVNTESTNKEVGTRESLEATHQRRKEAISVRSELTKQANIKPKVETVVNEELPEYINDRSAQIEATKVHGLCDTKFYDTHRSAKANYALTTEWLDIGKMYEDIGDEYNRLEKHTVLRPVDKSKPIGIDNYKLLTKFDAQSESSTKLRVSKLDKEGNILDTYNSIAEAVAANEGTFATKISAVCRYKRKSHAGYVWRYTE